MTAEAMWLKAVMGLLQAAERDSLPAPIAVCPREDRLHVQVEEPHFRAWSDAIESPVYEAKPHEDAIHMYVTGQLRKCQMVRVELVTVAHPIEVTVPGVTP